MTIGVIGYIGAGKSTVCRYLAEHYHFKHIDADQIVRNMYDSDYVIEFIAKNFPNALNDRQEIDRNLLRSIIFQDSKKNKILREFLWPLVTDEIKRQLFTLVKQGNSNIVVEGIGLLNIPLKLDRYIMVYAKHDELVKRVLERDGRIEKETNSILKVQRIMLSHLPNGTIMLPTDSSIEETQRELDRKMSEIMSSMVNLSE